HLTLELRIGDGLQPAESVLKGEHAKHNPVARDPHRCREPPPPSFHGVSRGEALGAPRALRLLTGRRVGWRSSGLRRGFGRGLRFGHVLARESIKSLAKSPALSPHCTDRDVNRWG